MARVTNAELKSIITENTATTNANFAAAKAAINGKVDKVNGKGLSTNDFTDALQTKLNGIAAGAQVNVIETVKVNGSALTPDANKAVDVTIPAAVSYTIAEAASATSGYLKTYVLKADGVEVSGSKIDIPKDYLVKSASMGTASADDNPIAGIKAGEPYLDFIVNTKDASGTDEHIYINVASLVDTYTEGNGINISSNVISVDTTDSNIADSAPTANSTKFVQSGGVKSALDDKVTKNSAITGAQKCKITYDAKGLVTAGADLEASDIPSLASSKISEMTGYEKASSVAAISTSDSLNQAVGKLEKALDSKTDTDDVRDIINAVIGDMAIVAWEDIVLS